MLFIKNLKQSFSSLLYSSFQESGPIGTPENNNETQAPNERLERQNLTPEQQELMEQIDALEQKYDSLQNTGKITSQISERLRQGLTSDPEIRNDPEARPTIEMFNHYRNQYLDATKQSNDLSTTINELKNRLTQASNTLEHEAGVDYNEQTGEIKELDKNNEELKTLNNKEFLALSPEARLQYITKNNIDSSDVANGNIDSLEFSFTFEGEYNRELYLETTAGQVLPKEVGEVNVGGQTFIRNNVGGEFFNSSNSRLVIHEGTNIQIGQLRTQEQIDGLNNQNNQLVIEYMQNNPNSNELIVSNAINRGIDPKFASFAFGELIEGKSEGESLVLLEDAMTEFDRYRGSYNIGLDMVDGKYNDRLTISMFIKFTDDWKNTAQEYGIDEESINQAESNGEVNMGISADLIQNNDSLSEGGYLKGERLLQNPEFSAKLTQVASAIGANRSDLIKVMKAESALDPRAVNPQTNATGLIQFMPRTAEGLGTSVGHIRAMSAVEQLNYVERYFRQNSMGRSLDSIEKLYQAVFYPLSLTKGPNFVFGSERSASYARLVASQNGVISRHSARGDGLIDGHAFARYANNHVSRFSA